MAVVPWLGLICGAFVASSPLANTPPTLALLASNQTSHLRLNGSALDMVNIGGPQAAVTSNNSRLGDDAYRCSSQTYGRPLAEGCKEAYEALSDTSELVSFRARTAAPELGIALPSRSISSDGKSVLQLSLQDGADFDQVSGQFLRKIAASLVEVCVIKSHEGGAVFKIGELGLLTLSIQEYTPNVDCTEPGTKAADIGSCLDILDNMPTTPVPVSFGHRGNPMINVGLPLSFGIEGGECVIELQITGEFLIASWYKLWAAAVAAVGICVRKNQDGVATVEGSIANVTLSVSRQGSASPSGTITTA